MVKKQTASEALLDATIRHQIKLLRFSKGQAAAARKILEASDKELVEKIAASMTEVSTARLQSLLVEVRRMRKIAAMAVGKSISEDMPELAQNEAEWELEAIQASVPVELKLASVSVATMKGLLDKPINGVPLEGWLGSMEAGDVKRIEQQLQLGVTQGETMDQLVTRIRGTKANDFNDGVLATTRRNAETIARTAVNHMSNSARQEVWNANSDIIDGVRWVATLDGRTSDVCRGRDGLVFPLNEGPRPPAHPGCRSTTVPVLVGEAIVGDRPFVRDTRTRAARETDFRAEAKASAGDKWKGMTKDERAEAVKAQRTKWADENIGQTPTTTNYDAWMRKQPAAFQNEVLGKTKADIFRGGLTLDKFVDEKGKAYTIAQLKAETSGDKLFVTQPGVGMKAKALLQQGLTGEQVIDAIKAEYPDANTSLASIASYKSELKKAGALDLLVGKAPTAAIKQVQSVADVVTNLEANLPAGVKHALGGQWANIAEDLDGGAYGYYQAGKGVVLSGKKLSAISNVQAQQVAAHELGHLLHKQHDLHLSGEDLLALKASVQGLSPEAKKQLGYYLVSTDELVAEVYSQAISPSLVTSQGLSALEFNKTFSASILAAKKAMREKFPVPAANAKPPMPGAPSLPFEVAGKHTTVGSLAKALLQQGLPDDKVLAAVLTEFPSAKTSKASLSSYKVELKKAGLLPSQGSGVVIPLKVAPPDAVPTPMTAPALAVKVSPPVNLAVNSAAVNGHALELMKMGMLNTSDLVTSLQTKFPLNTIKPENLASLKSKWKKDNPDLYSKAAKLAAGVANAAAPAYVPKLVGKTLALQPQKVVDDIKSMMSSGSDLGDVLEHVVDKGYEGKQASDLIELAVYELEAAKIAVKPYLSVAAKPVNMMPPLDPFDGPTKTNLPTPKLAGSTLGNISTEALGKIKASLIAGGTDADAHTIMGSIFGPSYVEAKGMDLLELAKYEVATKKSVVKSGPKPPPVAAGRPSLVPTRVATTPREGLPPPPRYTDVQRHEAIKFIAGGVESSALSAMNRQQRSLGLEALTAEEAGAIKSYTGSLYGKLNTALRRGDYAKDTALQAYVEAAQHGLAKMPKFTGDVTRGLTINSRDLADVLATYTPGAVVEEQAFISTSTGGKAAFGGNMFMKIKSKKGVLVEEFSNFTSEREVLFGPGTRLRVLSVTQNSGKYIIEMEEIDG